MSGQVRIEDIRIPWCESPFLDALLERAALPAQEERRIRDFARDGILVIDLDRDGSFDDLARRIVEGCSRIDGYDFRVQDAWDRVGAVRELACREDVLSILRELYRAEPIPMQTLNFGRGTEQRAHSDDFHFSCHPKGFMCGVWVALEDIDELNGPLEYYPGSHRLPYLDLSHIGLAGSRQKDIELYPLYEEMIQAVIRGAGLERREVRLKKGQGVIWAANLLHGGTTIRDPSRTRHSQVTHYYFENCLYYQPQHSDPVAGRVLRLEKPDLRTGRPIPHVHAGRRLATRGPVYRLAKRLGIVKLVRKLRGKP